jgi:hypothetical protein
LNFNLTGCNSTPLGAFNALGDTPLLCGGVIHWYLSGSRRLKDRVKAQDTGRKVKDLIFRVKGKDLKNKRETICG